MELILPCDFAITDRNVALFALLGPNNQGCDGWQETFCVEIETQIPSSCVILSHPLPKGHPLETKRCSRISHVSTSVSDWRKQYYGLAIIAGCPIFWFPNQSVTVDTLANLIQWSARLTRNSKPRIVVGIEPGYPDQDSITHHLQKTFGSQFPTHPTIQATVTAAIQKAT